MCYFPLSRRKQLYTIGLLLSLILTPLLLSACGDSASKVYNIAVVFNDQSQDDKLNGLKAGLKSLGYTEGANVRFTRFDAVITGKTEEQRKADLKPIVDQNFDLYWVSSGNLAQAFRLLVTDKPIVVAGVSDPVDLGIAQTVNQPGLNVTGVDSYQNELTVTRLNWIKKINPDVNKVYLLYLSIVPSQKKWLEPMRTEAARLGITLIEKGFATTAEGRAMVPTLKASEAQAVLGVGIVSLQAVRAELKPVVEREKLILAGGEQSNLGDGALFSCGSTYYDMGRQSASYVDKILRGTSPGQLAIQQPDKVELVLNQKLADQLGIKFPEAVLQSADTIIK
jgi:putative tryptophan/tyrosine transport system substrate-binding protein